MLENAKPIRCVKARYYDDASFIDRLKSISLALAALKKELPTREVLDHLAFTRAEFSTIVPVIDVSTYKARVEKHTRPIRPGEILDLAKLAIDRSVIPPVDDQVNPSKASARSIGHVPNFSFLLSISSKRAPRKASDGVPDFRAS